MKKYCKKIALLIIVVCSIAFFNGEALALRISIEPVGAQNIFPGDNISFDVKISQLGNFSMSSLGGFDMDILFNPKVLEYVTDSLIFGPFLGNDPFGQWVDGPNRGPSYGEIAYDAIRIQEVSFESIDWLHDNQPDTFTLANLTFKASGGVGHSFIIPDNIILSDAGGNEIIYDTRGIGSVNVVPEPSTFLLLGLGFGLSGLVALRKRKKG